ncbi:MAG: hypothetical protein AB7Q37_11795 [Pyrinomonadaceae bacterium]
MFIKIGPRTMNPINSLLTILLLALTAMGQNSPVPETASPTTDLAGEYLYSSGYVGANYKLFGDGRFEYSSFSDCCDPVWREAGTFVLEGDQLQLRLTTKTLNEYNLLDAKQATKAFRKLYDEKGEVKPGEIETEYSMHVVRWGSRIYLVPPKRLHLFVAAICFDVEPRSRVIHRDFLTTQFFLRRGDETKEVGGVPTLPEWHLWILRQSRLKATITQIVGAGEGKSFVIDKGSRDGVKIGMALARENIKPDHDSFLWVESVSQTSARLISVANFRSPDFEVGSVLVSKATSNARF